MKRSTKLGLAGVLFLGSVFIPPYSNWRGPVNVAAAAIAALLGYIASQKGSRWWLAIPIAVFLMFVVGIILAINAT